MPGSFPGEGADNPYATSSIDPRVDSTTRTAPTTSGVGSGVGSGIGSGVGSGVDTQRETTSSFPTSQTEFAAPSGPPPSQSATQSRLDEPSGFAAGQSTGGSRFNESQGLASSQNLGQYRLDESQGYTSGQSLGQSRLGEPQGFTSGQTIGQSRLDEPQGIVGDRSTAQSGMDSQTSAIEGSTFHDRVTGGGLSDEGSRVAGTTGTVGTGSYDTGPTSSTTTTGAEDPNNRSGGRGKMGAILGAVGLGGAAAGGKEAYDKHEARDTSAVADTSSGYTGPPAHHRKESIPTTAYPSGSFEGGRAQNAPVGGTQPRFEQISESSSGAPGHDSAVSGTGLAHQSEPYSTSRAAEYATPVAAAVGGGALGSELGHQSGHQTRTPQEVEERARQDSWRAQAAGASSGGPQAYDSRGHEQARSAAGISAPLGHDSARDTQTSNIGSEPHRSEHGTGAVAGTTAAVAGVGAGAYALGEHEKHGATTGTTTGGYTAGDNLTSATDSTTHRDSTGMTGLAAADAADKEKYDHHHNKLQKSKKGKPGLFRRIFKSRKNKDTGADEDYSSEEEHLEDDKKSHGSGIAGGTALGAAGLGTAGASSSGTRDADETVGSRSGIRHDEMSTSMPTTGGTVADLPEDTTGTHGLSSTSAIGPDSSNYGATESYGALETEGGLSGQRAAAPAHDTTTAGTTGTAPPAPPLVSAPALVLAHPARRARWAPPVPGLATRM